MALKFYTTVAITFIIVFICFFSYNIIMKSLSLEKENTIKDIINLFRLKKELNYVAIKDIRNLFRVEKN